LAAKERYIYDCASERAVFYETDNYVYPLASSEVAYRVDGDYLFCVKTERIAFWILGKQLYGHIGNGELTRVPTYHYGD